MKTCDKCGIEYRGKSIFCYKCRGIKLFPVSCRRFYIDVDIKLDCYNIKLSNQNILFDYEDYEKVIENRTYIYDKAQNVFKFQNKQGRWKLLHRYIFGNPNNKVMFKNGNKLDMRECNMYSRI